MTAKELSLISTGDLPQDPFLPVEGPYGPSFLDTEACVCAWRNLPAGSNPAWQCLGNSTQGVYTVSTGKWFNALGGGGGGAVNGSVSDASHPPDTTRPLVFDPGAGALQSAGDEKSLSVYDKACTGHNQTTFSTAFYRAAAELAAGDTPVDAAPCFRPGAIPAQIQSVDSWQKDGCNPGFLCTSCLAALSTSI